MINLFYKYKPFSRLLIFKTDIKTQEKVKRIKPHLNNHIDIKTWSIDMEDIDNVLRVEASNNLKEKHIINLITTLGFYCDELTD